MFTEDLHNNRDFRLILSIVFYHGKARWEIPDSFIDILNVPNNELKKYLVNFSYVLFDTKEFDERNKSRFGENLYLISVLIVLQKAYDKNDIESVKKIIKNLNKEQLIELIYEENKQGGKKNANINRYNKRRGFTGRRIIRY